MMPCVYLLRCSSGGSHQSPFHVFAGSGKHITTAATCKSRSRRFFKLLWLRRVNVVLIWVSGDQCRSVGHTRDQWGSVELTGEVVELIGGQWGLEGLSEGK